MKVDERKMDDIPEEDRPREKLIKYGPGVLNDAELLAILLRTGVKGCNVYELARRFMKMLGKQGLMEMRAWSVEDFRGRIREYVEAVPKRPSSQPEEGGGVVMQREGSLLTQNGIPLANEEAAMASHGRKAVALDNRGVPNVAERSSSGGGSSTPGSNVSVSDGNTSTSGERSSSDVQNASVPTSEKGKGKKAPDAQDAEASQETEYRRLLSGIGDDKCATILAALEIGRRIFPKEGVPLKKPLMRPEEIAKLMFADVSRYTREGFWAIYMDRRRVPLREPFMLTLGLAQQTLIDVKTVFRNALLFNAAGIYLVHNHPSGDVRPSSADLETTRTLVRAGRLLQIPILDHVIIGRPEISPSFHSLRLEQDCEF